MEIIVLLALKQTSQVNTVHIPQKMEVTCTSSHDIQVTSNQSRTMEPTFLRHSRRIKLDLPPLLVDDIENPHVIQV